MQSTINALYAIYQQHPKICTDSRQVIPGSIFFALSGPSFNGNTFAAKALEDGCAYAVVDQAEYATDHRYVLVEDSLKALQDLATHHRRQLKCTVIGITGSNGKTTTKELLAAVLKQKFRTIATVGNLNNHIGVPLTLLGIPADTEMAVIEMGASKQGDIQELVEIAEPDFGLITNIGKAHLEGMGGYEGVVKTKTEMYDYLRAKNGHVFVNTHHAVFIDRSAGMKTVPFGANPDDFVQGAFIDSDPYVRFKWVQTITGEALEDQSITETQLMGYYNYENLLAAATVGSWFGIEKSLIDKALASYNPVNNRSQLFDSGKNLLILDAYNANPTSMEAALTNFKNMHRAHKVVILGKMMELGPTWPEEHRRIAQLGLETGAEQVFLVGDLYTQAGVTNASKIFSQVEEAVSYFKENPLRECCILIKGSRSNRLELLKELF